MILYTVSFHQEVPEWIGRDNQEVWGDETKAEEPGNIAMVTMKYSEPTGRSEEDDSADPKLRDNRSVSVSSALWSFLPDFTVPDNDDFMTRRSMWTICPMM